MVYVVILLKKYISKVIKKYDNMRYKSGQKEETRQRMLEAASRSFRSHGYAGIGVDGIAKAAGVTSGAFYTHFGSKDAAFQAAVAAGLDEVIASVPRFQRTHGKDWVEAFSDYYVGRPHREDLGVRNSGSKFGNSGSDLWN